MNWMPRKVAFYAMTALLTTLISSACSSEVIRETPVIEIEKQVVVEIGKATARNIIEIILFIYKFTKIYLNPY